MDADILVFVLKAVYAANFALASTQPTYKAVLSDVPPGLRRYSQTNSDARTGHGGLLDGLAPRHLLARLAGTDDAGDDLVQPRRIRPAERTDAELLDQHDGVAARIPQQHGDRIAALEAQPADLVAPAAGEALVLQPVFGQREALINLGTIDDPVPVFHALPSPTRQQRRAAMIPAAHRPACAAVLLLATAAACVDAAPASRSAEAFRVEVAETEAERERGLMYRAALPAGSGMLFVQPRALPVSFWMKNTHVALDILWFDAQGRLVKISARVPPCTADPCPLYPSGGPVAWVLEIAAGEAARQRIRIGDRLKVEAARLNSAAQRVADGSGASPRSSALASFQ